jgi:hypothetical protein
MRLGFLQFDDQFNDWFEDQFEDEFAASDLRVTLVIWIFVLSPSASMLMVTMLL